MYHFFHEQDLFRVAVISEAYYWVFHHCRAHTCSDVNLNIFNARLKHSIQKDLKVRKLFLFDDERQDELSSLDQHLQVYDSHPGPEILNAEYYQFA